MSRIIAFSTLFLFAALVATCHAAPPTATQPAASEPLVVYGWAGYIPQSILDAFTREFHTPVLYRAYDDQTQAVEELRAGALYDVVILGDSYIPPAAAEGLLAELDLHNIDNFRNLGANFRDLAYDPGNRYTVMIQYGTTGLVVRTDRTMQPVTRWADLWNPAYAGDIGVWPYGDELVGIALKALGYSLNSEDPVQLQEAEEKLLELSGHVYLLDPSLPNGASYLLDRSHRDDLWLEL